MRQENSEEETTQSYTVLTPGTIVSHYRIVRRIGLGGAGDVYLAEDAELDRTVALKFLAPRLCENVDSKASFTHEAQTTAKLNHPNIVTIYEVGEHADRPFFATEFVEGGSLRNYLARRELSMHEVLWLAIQVCDALSEAHANGVTHRDIKPSNILVDSRGRVKIVDFGLASVLGSDKLSRPGTIAGTAKYMSPEQAQGEEVDTRSDLFSFGVVLYEVITGRHPFERESEAGTLNAIIEEEAIPANKYRSSMPKGLDQVVFRLLQKDRRIRYQQASDVRSDLRNVLREIESKGVVFDQLEKPHQPSIAVLPFSNLSVDKEQEYFCEGIAEELINALTRIKGLRVTARTSTLPFRDGKDDVREIGRKLNVETLLEGSVRKAGNRLRITAQLIDAASGFHLWSERFDREMEDVFAIQDEIAENIAKSLQVFLSEDEQQAITKVPTTDIEAYDYYLRGRQFFHQRRKKGLQFAWQMFARATELDSDFSLAYACMADCCSLLVHYYGESSEINIDLADQASLKALELAPDLAEAHAARGFALWLLGRLEESGQEFEVAIRQNPKLFDARYFYARSCYQRGKLVAAVQLFEEACQIREDHEARYFAAQTYSALNRLAEAQTAYMRALQAIEKHLELNPDDARAVTMGAVSWCRIGQPSTGVQWAERALDIDPEDAGVRYNVACLFALEGHHDRAIECLEDAVRAGFAHRDWVENDPDLDSLRDNPRFKALKWRE